MAIMDGMNISPAEIEQVMFLHPAAADAAATTARHAVLHEVPVCAVALHPGATADAAQLQAHARQHLGARAPQRVLVLHHLPRNEQASCGART
ncbi:MAG: hypothetical protein QE285_19430 [Aquabacterium sp.]|nr:hypothetical protein [Aquabacterium sp.]